MIKFGFIFICCLLFFDTTHAQKKGQVLFLTNSGFTTVRDSADYMLAILPPDTAFNKKLFVIKEYYPDGKLKLNGTSIMKELPLEFQGPCITFFPSGRKMTVRNYEKGEPVGDEFDYYPNGKMYAIKGFTTDKKIILKKCLDSTGRILSDTGNGKWIAFDKTFKNHAEGKVVNGLKEGEWRGKVNDTVDFVAVYQSGNIVSSRFTDKTGNEHLFGYDADYLPEYKGGQTEFYKTVMRKFISSSISTPGAGIAGDMTIEFLVKKDGTVADVKIVKGVNPQHDALMLKAITFASGWQPGYEFGVPVAVKFTIPMVITMGGN